MAAKNEGYASPELFEDWGQVQASSPREAAKKFGRERGFEGFESSVLVLPLGDSEFRAHGAVPPQTGRWETPTALTFDLIRTGTGLAVGYPIEGQYATGPQRPRLVGTLNDSVRHEYEAAHRRAFEEAEAEHGLVGPMPDYDPEVWPPVAAAEREYQEQVRAAEKKMGLIPSTRRAMMKNNPTPVVTGLAVLALAGGGWAAWRMNCRSKLVKMIEGDPRADDIVALMGQPKDIAAEALPWMSTNTAQSAFDEIKASLPPKSQMAEAHRGRCPVRPVHHQDPGQVGWLVLGETGSM
jgi:hypothetical protein